MSVPAERWKTLLRPFCNHVTIRRHPVPGSRGRDPQTEFFHTFNLEEVEVVEFIKDFLPNGAGHENYILKVSTPLTCDFSPR